MEIQTRKGPDAATGVAGTPVAAPLPVPITAAQDPGIDRSSRLVIGAIILVALLSMGAIIWLGIAALGPALHRAAVSRQVRDAIAARAAKDYPTFAIDSIESMTATSTVVGIDREVRCYVTMHSRLVGGFAFRTVYSAPVRDIASPARFVDEDLFFATAGTADASMTGSFQRTWVLLHPGSLCVSVANNAMISGKTMNNYDVLYFPRASSKVETAYLLYDTGSSTWGVASSGGESDAAQAPNAAFATRPDGSLVDTAAAVSEAYPGFEPYEPYREPTGTWGLLVRDSRYHDVMLSIDPGYLSVVARDDDTRLLVSSGGAKSTSFMKAWTAKHGGTVITYVGPDPDYRGPDLMVDILYATAPPEGSLFLGDDMSCTARYNVASHRWTVTDDTY